MAEKIHINIDDNQSLTALYSVPESSSVSRIEKTLIIMSHGFPGHKSSHNDIYGEIHSLLARKNFNILRFDFRGCGESDGKEEDFTIKSASEDFKAVLKWAKGEDYNRFIYIGEGLGAAISLLNNDKDVAAFVFFWPVLDLNIYRKSYFNIRHVDEDEMKRGYVEHEDRRIGTAFLKELTKMDITEDIQNIRRPVFIMHGHKDKKISIEQLDIARRYMNAHRIEITNFHDGEHGLPKENHRKSISFQIQQFIEKYI